MSTNLNSRPKLSICIPVYNKKQTLARTLESIERQNLDSLEVIIVDNASTDGSLDVLREWSGRLTPKIYRHEETISPSENWIYCLSLGTGMYLKLQLAGDVIPDNALSTLMDTLDKDPSAGFAHGKTKFLNLNPAEVPFAIKANEVRAAMSHLDCPKKKADLLAQFRVRINVFGDPVFIMRRELLPCLRLGVMEGPCASESSPDLEMWLRLFAATKSIFIDQDVSHFYMGDHRHKSKDAITRLYSMRKLQSLWFIHLEPSLKDLQRHYSYRFITWSLLSAIRDFVSIHPRLEHFRKVYKALRFWS